MVMDYFEVMDYFIFFVWKNSLILQQQSPYQTGTE